MTAPKHAVPTKKGRYYTDPSDTSARYVSVTNVIDTAISKPALIAWAARTVAEEAVDNIVQVVKLARSNRDGAVAWLKGQPFEKRDAAAKVGSRLHDLAERHALGQDLGEIEPDVAGMVSQYRAFVDDFRPIYEATEATVVNRTIGYAGTLDGLIRIPSVADALRVKDTKTGATGPYGEWALQLAAYANAEALWLPDGTEVPMPEIDKTRGFILRVRPDFYALHEADLTGLFDVFTHMVAVTRCVHEQLEVCVTADPLIPILPPSPVAVPS